jgi:hypothetical protein
MKTTKAKAPAKPGRPSVASTRAVKSKRVAAVKSQPSEDDIRAKAKEIYNERIARGEHGTAEDDWHKAVKLLSGSKK